MSAAAKSLLARFLGVLLGEDGVVSWSKLVTAWVLTLYSVQRPPDALVAGLAIAASFGAREFRAWLKRGTWTLGATSSTSVVHQRTEVDERRAQAHVQITDARRDATDGIEVTR